jgi:hypothetical protein
MNDALLRIEIEHVGASRDVTVWLSAYGLPEADVRAFRERWARTIASLF